MTRFFLAIVLILSGYFAQAQGIFKTNGVAVNGYDVVAYFNQHRAVKGVDQLTMTWEGAEWKFSTKENLEAFKKTPQRFVPQFGGYCAYGVSQNHKSPTDPMAFTILDDKLYLNYNMSVKEKWSGDTKEYIKKAETYWPELLKQNQ